MKTVQYLITALCLFAAPNAWSEIDEALPDLIREGFQGYARGGRMTSWNTWTQYIRQTNVEFIGLKEDYDRHLDWAENHLGPMLRAEQVQTDLFGKSYKIVYALWGFERGAIFVKFHCYQTKEGWRIKYFNIDPDPEKLIPGRAGNPLPNHELRVIKR